MKGRLSLFCGVFTVTTLIGASVTTALPSAPDRSPAVPYRLAPAAEYGSYGAVLSCAAPVQLQDLLRTADAIHRLLPALPRTRQSRQLCEVTLAKGLQRSPNPLLHRVVEQPALLHPAETSELEPSPLDRLLPYLEREGGIGIEKPGLRKPVHDELEERTRIGIEAVNLFSFGKENLDQLDELMEGYRRSGERTASGVTMLSTAYRGFFRESRQILSDEQYHARQLAKLDEWGARKPQSVTPKMLRAIALREFAYATLNEKSFVHKARNRKLFRERLKPLVAYLRDIKPAVERQDAYWYVLMLEARSAQDATTSELFSLLDEGSNAFPNEIDIYLAAAEGIASVSNNLFDDMESVAVLATFRAKDHGKSAYYARTYWGILNLIAGVQNLHNLKIDWHRFAEGAREVIAKYPVQWNIQHFAAFLCFGGEAKVASELFKSVKGRPIVHAWGDIAVHDRCREWVNDPVNQYGKNSVPLEQ